MSEDVNPAPPPPTEPDPEPMTLDQARVATCDEVLKILKQVIGKMQVLRDNAVPAHEKTNYERLIFAAQELGQQLLRAKRQFSKPRIFRTPHRIKNGRLT